MERRLPLIALILDVLIFGLAAFAATWMCLGANGMLQEGGIGFLKFFTVESNILLGIVAAVAIPFDALLLAKKRAASPTALRVAYLGASMGTTLTMLVVIFFLGPTMGFAMMYSSANLFMHLFIPLLGVARVLFFESNKEPAHLWLWAIAGTVHMAIYGIFYTVNVAVHNGYGSFDYDWYGFGANGLAIGLVTFFGLLVGAYLSAVGIVALQRLILSKRK